MPDLIIRLFPRWRRWGRATPACGSTTNLDRQTSCGHLRASLPYSRSRSSTTYGCVSPVCRLRWSSNSCWGCCTSRAGPWMRWDCRTHSSCCCCCTYTHTQTVVTSECGVLYWSGMLFISSNCVMSCWHVCVACVITWLPPWDPPAAVWIMSVSSRAQLRLLSVFSLWAWANLLASCM